MSAKRWRAVRLGGLATLILWSLACSSYQRFEGTKLIYRRVTPPVAFEILRDSPNALVMDLRPAAEFDGGKRWFRRTRNLPLAELADRLAELDGYRESTFLVYCGADAECGLAGMRLLAEHGCVYAVLIDGAFNGWEDDEPDPEGPSG